MHDTSTPSNWVVKHARRIKPGGDILDIASGQGRHTRYLLGLGYRVMALDLNIEPLTDLDDNPDAAVMAADLENGPWPLGNATFDGIVVVNYLWRPLFPHIRDAIAPGGVVIYETFQHGNEAFGRPSNPDFLLKENELREEFADFDILDFEAGEEGGDRPTVKQKICAVKPA
ncbi:MAG: methyltransferase domain-containing protein, partial [Alphaproteobacteria bacterium]|nr:methyltransferase domain-containing protein [Alphaproteobacteria bacterium]